MNRTKKSILSCLLIAAVFFAALPLAAVSAAEATVVRTADELFAAVEAIPTGGAGEITIRDMYMYLNEGLYIEEKDVTFNLINASLVTAAVEGFGQPVIFGADANITINADDNSRMQTEGHTGNMGVVRIDNITDWDEATQKFEKDFTLTINGGYYTCTDTVPEEHEPDYVFAAAPGTKVVLSNVICDGPVVPVDFAGVGITVPGEVTVHSGKFANDIREYAVEGAFSCQVEHSYYVRAKEFSDEFLKVVPNGKVEFPYAKPDAEVGASWLIAEEFTIAHEDFTFDPFEDFSDDYSTLELTLYPGTAKEEIHAVEVVWNYSEDVLETVNTFVEKFPEERNWFHVTDLELVNYWLHNNADSAEENATDTLANYSGELRAYLDNSNFLLPVENRAGADDVFYTERIGSAKLMHNGTAYATFEALGARAEHVIYVPESTADTKEALAAAAQKRIDDYIGANRIKITAAEETITDYYTNTLAEFDAEIAAAQEIFDREEAKNETERDWNAYWDAKSVLDYTPDYKQYFMESFEEGGELHFLRQATGDFCFDVEVKEGREPYKFIIIKDDDKLAVPTYATVDLNTKVQVKANSSALPLDTTVQVEKLTAGDAYENVLKTLKVDEKDSETYDIRLHSESLGGYVTKLQDGKFEVTLPLPEELKDRDLAVYYVDADGKTEVYEATPTNDRRFVAFNTDHFSIYTLAAVSSDNGSDGNGTALEPTQKEDAPASPATGENSALPLWLALAVVSGGILLSLRKKVTC